MIKPLVSLRCCLVWIVLCGVARCRAEENVSAADAAAADGLHLLTDPAALRGLVESARRSVVVISFSGRSRTEQGLGSGFILREDGLIATNLHVIGEARPITVKLLDGRSFDVQQVFATDKVQDLAILKVDAAGLPALPLGDAESLKEGDPLVAIGNPEGLTHSVVTGVAGLRDDVQGMDMIQLAMPIERGNSGGPVLNLQGQVVGLVTLKSLAKENVGFAVVSKHLRPLLEQPNPIAMSRWLTIGVLNPRLWETSSDSNRWTQRAGRIRAAGSGAAFGGRSLCLSKEELPAIPYELAVTVKMEQADGAAGLVFFGDGGDRHYGFYLSGRKLRLTQFDGPTVYQWNVLRDERHRAYREGDWNHLKVRVETERFQCYCNDALVFELPQDGAYGALGRVGLAKFRHTTAEFKGFRVGHNLPPSQPTSDLMQFVTAKVAEIRTDRPPTTELLAELSGGDAQTRHVLDDRARLLEQQARRLRQLAQGLHAQEVTARLQQVLDSPSGEINLLRAALLVAAIDNDELDVDQYERQVQGLADEFLATLPGCVSEADRLDAFQRYLFEELGYHGSRTNYYAASNSYLNEVIDDREGLPITLSVLYIDMARRCGMNVVGIGLPQHFVVRFEPVNGDPQLIDPFHRGEKLTEQAAISLVEERLGAAWQTPSFEAQTPRQIIQRMLQNLINSASSAGDHEACLRYVNAALAIQPDSPEHRLFKAVVCLNTGRRKEGLAETDWVLERQPEDVAIEQVYRLRGALEALAE